jgi:hypothetical protein
MLPFVYPYDNYDNSEKWFGEVRLFALLENYNELLMFVPQSDLQSKDFTHKANKLYRECLYVEFLLKHERDEWNNTTYLEFESELELMKKILEKYYVPSVHLLS